MGNHHRTDVFPSPVINVPLRLHFTTLWRNKKNKIQEKKTILFLSLSISLWQISWAIVRKPISGLASYHFLLVMGWLSNKPVGVSFLVACYATLHPTLSVGRLVDWSHFTFFMFFLL